MLLSRSVADRHDAAVAAAEATAHHAFDGHLAALPESASDFRHSGEHRLRTARVDRHIPAGRCLCERAFERNGDATVRAAAAVFGGERDCDAEAFEKIQVEQL